MELTQFLLVAILTFSIHCIETMSYALRTAGVRSGKIATSAALFNIIFLFSRTAVAIQIPLLVKYVETSVIAGKEHSLMIELHLLIFMSSLGTIAGALLLRRADKIIVVIVEKMAETRSLSKTILWLFFGNARILIENPIQIATETQPKIPLLSFSKAFKMKTVFANMFAVSIFTIAGFSAITSAAAMPELRGTAVSLASVVNGLSSILFILFVIPGIKVILCC